jgi:zinc protease
MRIAIVLSLVPAVAMAGPPPIQERTLKNGLDVLVVEDHSVPLVTIEIATKNGSMTEPPEFNGLSHLYEHMFFKANAVIPNQEAYMERIRQLGIQFNGSTNTEVVNYYFTTTSDHLKDAMVFMRDAVVSPVFNPKELDQEKVVVTGEIDRNEANPYYHLFHTVEQKVWWKYPSRKDPLGNRQTVLKATPAQMKTIEERFYVPNNSALVVTGDVKADDIFAQAESLYANWKKSAQDPLKKYPLVKHPPIPKPEVVVVEQPVETVTGAFTWHGPSTGGSKDLDLTYAADVLSAAISEPSSTFQKDLVDSGACVMATFSWYTQRNVGPITFEFEAEPDKTDDCVKAVLAELPKMKAPDYLTAQEMKNAAHKLEVQQALERERPSQLASVLTLWWASSGLDYYLHYVEHLYKVTPAEDGRFMESYVVGKPYVFGALVSPEMIKEKHLDQAHFESLLGISKGGAPAHSTSKKEAAK